jgi:hypothetical protein
MVTKPLVAGLETPDSGDDKNDLHPVAIQRTFTGVVRFIQNYEWWFGSEQILFDDMSCTFEYASAIIFSSPLKGLEHVPEKHT